MHRHFLVTVAASLALIGSACGSGGTSAGPPAPAATSAPAGAAQPTALPAPPPAPPTAAVQPAAAPTAAAVPTPAPAPATPTPAGAAGLRLELAAGENEARYRAREQLAGNSLPNDAVGVTRDVTGSIAIGPGGAVIREQSKIVVDLRSLRSDVGARDSFIQRSTLETGRFPTAELVVTEVRDLPWPLPTSGEDTFQLLGDLTVHGVTHPTTWDVNARFGEGEVAGTASTSVTLANFGMTTPRVPRVLSIEENLRLELDFRTTRSPLAGATRARS